MKKRARDMTATLAFVAILIVVWGATAVRAVVRTLCDAIWLYEAEPKEK